MIEYHKIQSVYHRDPATKHKTFLEGQWSMLEFDWLKNNEWHWTEKVDGTNIRAHWNGEKMTFGGRTEAAQMPTFLLYKLEELFPKAKMQEHFPAAEYQDVMLYGEGFGAKIQKGGGNYIADGCDFALFDVQIRGIFLERPNVEDIAAKLGIKVAPVVGKGTLLEAIEMVKAGIKSTWGDFPSEGLVMRPAVVLLTRVGDRIITKVKCKDFGGAK